MATFVIVHGAWSGAHAWRWVRPLLREAGHEVFTPSLTGLGERAHLANLDIDLNTHVQDVVGTLHFEDLRDVILVGHSYGGMVITVAADRSPDRIAHLVYLDAEVPEDGQAEIDLISDEERLQAQETMDSGERQIPPPVPSPLPADLPTDVRWALSRMRPQPLRTYTQPARVSERLLRLRRTYVLHTEGKTGQGTPDHVERARADPPVAAPGAGEFASDRFESGWRSYPGGMVRRPVTTVLAERLVLPGLRTLLSDDEELLAWTHVMARDGRRGVLLLTSSRCIAHWPEAEDVVVGWDAVRGARLELGMPGELVLVLEAEAREVTVRLLAASRWQLRKAARVLRTVGELTPSGMLDDVVGQATGEFPIVPRGIRGHVRRVAVTALGVLLLLVGVLFASPFLPGPGILTIIAGLALLATEYDWAKDIHHWARNRVARLRTEFQRRRARRRTRQR